MALPKRYQKRGEYAEEYAGGAGHVPPAETSTRITEIADPGSSGKRVMQFEVREGDTYPTANPRCQLNGGKLIEFNESFWFGFRFWLPSEAEGGPALIAEWCNLWEFFGQPYTNSPTIQLGLHSNGTANELLWVRNGGYSFDEPFKRSLVTNKWHSALYHIKHSTKANGGFVELWIDDNPITFFSGGTYNPNSVSSTTKLEMNVLETGNNDTGKGEIIPQLYLYSHTFSPWKCYYDEFVVAANQVEAQYWKNQVIRADEDLTTTGWTETPLYSKVNDTNDATVIKATLS
jgi:hypothetical protein